MTDALQEDLARRIVELETENAKLRAIAETACWHYGTHEGFTHILYCNYCHYSQAHGHGVDCILRGPKARRNLRHAHEIPRAEAAPGGPK